MSDTEDINLLGLEDEDNSHDEDQVNSDDEELFAASLKNKKHSLVAKRALSKKKKKASSGPVIKRALGRFSEENDPRGVSNEGEEDDEVREIDGADVGPVEFARKSSNVEMVEEVAAAEENSSSGGMFDSDAPVEVDDNEFSVGPQSAKFTQDEEFTDPDDPVTVTKTALHIDKVTMDEELERKIKYRK